MYILYHTVQSATTRKAHVTCEHCLQSSAVYTASKQLKILKVHYRHT